MELERIKIKTLLSKMDMETKDFLHMVKAESLSDAARLNSQQIMDVIVKCGSYNVYAVTEFYKNILGRDADPDGLKNHVDIYRTDGWHFSVAGFFDSDEYWGKSGANSISFLSATWRDLTGRDDLSDIDNLAAALDRGDISRNALVNALIARPEVIEHESTRLWAWLTGRSDAPPEIVVTAFEQGGREDAIRTICDHPAFAAHAVESVGSPYLDPIVPIGGVHEMDVYRSYDESDVVLLKEFAAESLQPADGYFTDFLGRITDCKFIDSIGHLDGKVAAHIPVPSDGFQSETIEYLGLAMAFKTLTREEFVCAELGAGWGPWTAAAGVIARARGIEQTKLLAVEAGIEKVGQVTRHLQDNGLQPDGLSCRVVHGAVWISDGEVQFPSVPLQDHGAAAAETAPEQDYRGASAPHVPVPAYTIETLLGEHEVIDFIHIDIQGAEADICEHSIAFLKERVRYLFIATHSRSIEGRLITLFRSHGFDILREKPCRFRFDHWTGILEGITTADGGQLWRNPKFA